MVLILYLSYIKELVEEWGYTEADAKARDSATMAWMAVPLINQLTDKVEGVVYLDSVDPDYFDNHPRRLATEVTPPQIASVTATERTISKPDATLEVKLVEIPQTLKEAISQSLQEGRKEAREERSSRP